MLRHLYNLYKAEAAKVLASPWSTLIPPGVVHTSDDSSDIMEILDGPPRLLRVRPVTTTNDFWYPRFFMVVEDNIDLYWRERRERDQKESKKIRKAQSTKRHIRNERLARAQADWWARAKAETERVPKQNGNVNDWRRQKRIALKQSTEVIEDGLRISAQLGD